MADILTFDPRTEFEVLETIEDFEEQLQRPEELRFFTLDEQLLDFFQKMLPQRKATRFELKQLEKERERLQIAYEKLITVNETEYVVDLRRKSVNVSWVKPIYGDFSYKKYDWNTEWNPIGLDRKTAVYYPRMMTALPKPYISNGQDGRHITKSGEFVNGEGENPIRGLGMYKRTKLVYHDDRSIDVVEQPMVNTQDDLKIIGYHLDQRPFDLPNPLSEHPFLKSIQPGKIITDMELVDLFPSIPAIIEHAVPVTNDPYGQGLEYLKLYDVKLSQIPWSSWKTRFPSVPAISATLPVESLTFPKKTKTVPDERISKYYATEWQPAYHTRKWLQLQVDGGNFVSKLMLTSAGDLPLLATSPLADSPEPVYPPASPHVCESLVSDFDTFLNAGLFRFGKKDKEGFAVDDGVCVPIGMIQKEQSDTIHSHREAWKETTKETIVQDYEKILQTFQLKQVEKPDTTYAKIEQLQPSERRLNVLSILDDNMRTPDDQADAIEMLTRDIELRNKIYVDVEGRFVVCMHTLSLLRGDLEEDRLGFYSEWTLVAEGRRVCRFCAEEINKDVIVATDEYDEDGHIVASYEALSQTVYHGHDPLESSLVQMKGLFDLTNQGELLMYTLLSLIQVVPQEEQLTSIVQFTRRLTASLRASRKLGKEVQERTEGMIGLAGLIILLQTHSPFLIQKRSFGGKSLSMSGFPRDTDDAEDAPLLNGLINIIKHIVKSYPSTFKSQAMQLIASGKHKSDIVPILKTMAKNFRTLLDSAKERYQVQPVQLEHLNDILTPIVHIDNPFFKHDEAMGKEEMSVKCSVQKTSVVWTTRHPAKLMQVNAPLYPKIYPSPSAVEVVRYSESVTLDTTEEKLIRDRLKLGVPSGFPVFTEFVKRDNDGIVYLSITSRILDILSLTDMSQKDIQTIRNGIVYLNTHISSPLLRDIAKGIFFETLHLIKSNRNATALMRVVLEATKKDIGFRMLLLSKDVAEEEDDALIAKERLTLTQRYREMNDAQREMTKMLVDIGVSDYIFTNEDRERFALEYRKIADQDEDIEVDEEGYQRPRDYVDNGDVPVGTNGVELEVDYGDYGDRAVRDYNDYTGTETIDFGDDDGF